jgi:hypothetical protein
MLKNKKIIYLLIPLNIFVWGFFVYRFYTAYNEIDEVPQKEIMPGFNRAELKDSISYKLNFTYKDPFLKESFISSSHHDQSSAESPVTSMKPISPTQITTSAKQLPDIKYMGLIKNTNTGAVTALISLNGQSKIIKLNDVIEGISFKAFTRDSLVARWGKERLVLRK